MRTWASAFEFSDIFTIARLPAARIGKRAEAKIKREIPGNDDPDNAERLRDDTISRERIGHEVDVSALRLHPLFQIFGDVGDCFEHNEVFGEQGLEFRSVAVVGVDRCDQLVLVVFQ
jgi:hypothetical protein